MKKIRLGSHYGGHYILDNLQDDGIVYSCGIGDDATFDLAVIERYGCNVYAFDPTPKSIEWVDNQEWPNEFYFYDVGVSSRPGMGKFYLPIKEGNISHSVVERSEKSISVLFASIDELARMLGHEKIDVLKLDVEGAEYDIIDNFPQVPIEQVVVEFHHFFEGIGREQTVNALKELLNRGYKAFHVSKYNWGFAKC